MARRGVKEHRPTGLVERPLPGNGHGGCGGRSGETGWSQGQHRAPDRPYRLRDETYADGVKISDTEVQRRVITLAKLTVERAWLGEVASVPLVQACQNILAAGRADNPNACEASVRPQLAAADAEAGTHRSAARAALKEPPPFTAGRTSNGWTRSAAGRYAILRTRAIPGAAAAGTGGR